MKRKVTISGLENPNYEFEVLFIQADGQVNSYYSYYMIENAFADIKEFLKRDSSIRDITRRSHD